MKTAVIFAAGPGKRLSPLTKKIHKSLIKINNIPLIEYLINNLLQLKSLKEIIIITGYRHEDFLYLKNKYKKITIIFNEYYFKYESAYTLALLPKSIFDDDIFIISGDFIMKNNCFHDNIKGNFMAAMKRINKKLDWSYKLNNKGNIVEIVKSNDINNLLASEWTHIGKDWSKKIAKNLNNNQELAILKVTMIGKYLIDNSIKNNIELKPYLIDYNSFWDLDNKLDLERIKTTF